MGLKRKITKNAITFLVVLAVLMISAASAVFAVSDSDAMIFEGQETAASGEGINAISDVNALRALFSSGGEGQLSDNIEVDGSLTVTKNVTNLDLNGHNINLNGNNITVKSDITFNVNDNVAGQANWYGSWNENTTVYTVDSAGSENADHFTSGVIYNGKGIKNGNFKTGGAIYNENGQVTLNNIALAGNNTDRGGAVYNNKGNGSLKIIGSTQVVNNRSKLGAGIYSFSNLTITDAVLIKGNISTSNGAGIYSDGNLTISGSVNIIENDSNYNAGGVIVFGTAEISGSVIIAENRGAYGSGITAASAACKLIIKDEVQIINNHATKRGKNNRGGMAGGIRNFNKANTSIADSVKILGNTSANTGAGIVNGSVLKIDGSVQINNNIANFAAGGISNVGALTITGNVSITDNVAKRLSGGVYNGSDTSNLTVGESVKVKDNLLKTNPSDKKLNGTTANLYLDTNKTINISDEHLPTKDMYIGIITRAKPVKGKPIDISGSNSEDYFANFFADNTSYAVTTTDDTNTLQLSVVTSIKNAADLKAFLAEGGEGRVENDITDVTEDFTVTSSLESDLNLNGYTINLNSKNITVPEDKALKVYDKSQTTTTRYGYWDNGVYKLVKELPNPKPSLYSEFTNGVIYGGKSATNGGAINNLGTLTLRKGTIAGNQAAQSGGGIYNSGAMEAGSTVIVKDNRVSETTNASNVYLPENKTVTVSTGVAAPQKEMWIGVTTAIEPTTEVPVNVTGENIADYTEYFYSDNNTLCVQNGVNNTVQLLKEEGIHNTDELREFFAKGGSNHLVNDIIVDSNENLIVTADKTVNLDLNSHTIDLNSKKIQVNDSRSLVIEDHLVYFNPHYGYWDNDNYKITTERPTDETIEYETFAKGIIYGGASEKFGGNINNNGKLVIKDVGIAGGKTYFIAEEEEEETKYGGGISNFGSESELTVTGFAQIAGNKAYSGGGIHNCDGAKVTISGNASIKNNKAMHGGGITNLNNQLLVTDNAEISSNKVEEYAGGVYNNAHMILAGNAVVKNNIALKGNSGIDNFSSKLDNLKITIGGNAQVIDNIQKDTGKVCNLCLMDGVSVIIDENTYKPQPDMLVGVTVQKAPTDESPVNITGKNTEDYSQYFVSDNEDCGIRNRDNIVQLVKETGITNAAELKAFFTSGGEGILKNDITDIAEDLSVTSNIPATLNLNDKNINLNGYNVTVGNGKTFTVEDDSMFMTSPKYGYWNNDTYVLTDTPAENIECSIFSKGIIYNGKADVDGGVIHNEGNFTIKSGAIAGTKSKNGALYNVKGGMMAVTGTVQISDNIASKNGGAIYNHNSIVNIGEDVTFNGNKAVLGGALYNETGKAEISDSAYFTDNSAQYGGALYNSGISSTISVNGDVLFEKNTASNQGGAVYNDATGVTIKGDVQILTNKANDCGGGIYNQKGTVDIKDSIYIQGNTALNGGGIYNNSDAVATLDGDAEILENEVTKLGGGIYNDGTLTVIDATQITLNIAAENGAGVYQNGTMTVGDEIVINDNKLNSVSLQESVRNNIYLPDGKLLKIAAVIVPREDMLVGVTTQSNPELTKSIDFTEANSADYSKYFFADNSSYFVEAKSDGVLQIVSSKSTLIHNTAELDNFFRNGGKGTLANDITIETGVYMLFKSKEPAYLNLNGKNIDLKDSFINIDSNSAKFIINDEVSNISQYGYWKDNNYSEYVFTKEEPVDIDGKIVTEFNSGAIYNGKTAVNGGAITNNGTLELLNVAFVKNSSDVGGAIYNNANLKLCKTTKIAGNKAAAYGAGICNNNTLELSDDVLIENNIAAEDGGGIYNKATLIAGDNVTILQNINKDSEKNNLYLANGKTVTMATGEDDPDYNMEVGITTEIEPAPGISVDVTGVNGGHDYSRCFVADDDDNYTVKTDTDGKVKLSLIYDGEGIHNVNELKKFFEKGGNSYLANSITDINEDLTVTAAGQGNYMRIADLNLNNFDINLNNHNITVSEGTVFNLGDQNKSIVGRYGYWENGVYKIASAEPSRDYIEILGGAIYNGKQGANGGAIYNKGKFSLINDVVIAGNKAQNGAGLYNDVGSEASIEDTAQISANIATANGGGIYNNGGLLNIREGIKLCYNEAQSNENSGGGGAIYITATDAEKDKDQVILGNSVVLSNNKAPNAYGGAIYVLENGNLKFTNGKDSELKFLNNTAYGSGAICNTGAMSTIGTDGNIEFSSNEAKTSNGGALYSDGSCKIEASNIKFEGNEAGLSGGAVFTTKSVISIHAKNELGFYSNWANLSGGAIQNALGAASFSSNQSIIFEKNKAYAFGGAIQNLGSNFYLRSLLLSMSENAAATGGAISNAAGAMEILGASLFNVNHGTAAGGAVHNVGGMLFGGAVEMAANTSAAVGGAIQNTGSLNIAGTATFAGNLGTYGAAINNLGAAVFAGGAAINANVATYYGGGLYNIGTTLFMGATTVDANAAVGYGGGIFVEKGNVQFSGAYSVNKNWVLIEGDKTTKYTSNVSLSKDTKLALFGAQSGYIGVTLYNHKPTMSNPIDITSSNSSDISSHFFSDSDNYEIIDGPNHKVQLAAKGTGIHNAIELQSFLDTGGTGFLETYIFDVTEDLVVRAKNAVQLDMNGYTIDLNGKNIIVGADKNLLIKDLSKKETKKYGYWLNNVYMVSTTEPSDPSIKYNEFTKGVIYGGHASNGGAINNAGTLSISDAAIAGNKANYGGGIYDNGTLTLGKNACVKDNLSETDGDNLYLTTGKKVSLDSPESKMSVFVSTQAQPVKDNSVDITESNDEDYSMYFVSDNDSYKVINGSGNVVQLSVNASDGIHNEKELRALFNSGGYNYLANDIVMEGDISAEATSSSKYINLDMNGHTINLNKYNIYIASEKEKLKTTNCIIQDSSSNSTVRYGYWENVSYKVSTTKPTDSSIKYSEFTKGIIYGGRATEGGSTFEIRPSGKLKISNIAVVGNKTEYSGAAIYNNGVFSVGEKAIIKDNVSIENKPCNVYLPEGKTISVDSPKSGMSIGVATRVIPVMNQPVNITTKNNADYSSYFFSDNNTYLIENSKENVVQLRSNISGSGIKTSAELKAFFDKGGEDYLAANITVGSEFSSNIPVSKTVKLNLNGHTINLSQRNIRIEKQGNLEIFDTSSVIWHGEWNGNTYKLTEGEVGSGYKFTGGVIYNGKAGAMGGCVYNDGGTFTMRSGALAGTKASTGGGIYNTEGTVVLKGTAQIVHNEAKGSGIDGYGGGIYNSYGTMTICDSVKIVGNVSGNCGGGIYDTCSATIIKGSVNITENQSLANGAAIYVEGSADKGREMKILDSVKITGNRSTKLGSVMAVNGGTILVGGSVNIKDNGINLYLTRNSLLKIATGNNKPTSDMSIGVSTEQTPPVDITGQNEEDYSSCFFSDNQSYLIKNDNNVLKLDLS